MYQASYAVSPEGGFERVPRAVAPMKTGGVYETVLVTADRRIPFADMHALRMGIGLLRLGVPRASAHATGALWDMLTERLSLADAALSGARRLRIEARPGQGGGVSYVVSVSPSTGYEETDKAAGVAALCLPIRRAPGPLARIKSTDVGVGAWARRYAMHRGAAEALWLTTGGEVIEGAFSNVFIVDEGRLITPPTPGTLPGITRGVVLVLAERAGILVEERRPTLRELAAADEAFLTSAAAGLLPLTSVLDADGTLSAIGTGVRGGITERLSREYDEAASLGGMPV